MATMTIRCKAHPGCAQGINCETCAEILSGFTEVTADQAKAIADGDALAASIEILCKE